MLIRRTDNYWLDTKTPCLTYGLRGINYYEIRISGPGADLHSGVFGGTVHEPMTDLILLSESRTAFHHFPFLGLNLADPVQCLNSSPQRARSSFRASKSRSHPSPRTSAKSSRPSTLR
jgi:hypothetical protein